MFTYSKSFVEKCLEVYPTWEDLHILLKSNSKRVGGMLYDALGFPLDEDTIISYFRNKKEAKVLEAAKRTKMKRDLYNEWVELVDNFADVQAERLGHEL